MEAPTFHVFSEVSTTSLDVREVPLEKMRLRKKRNVRVSRLNAVSFKRTDEKEILEKCKGIEEILNVIQNDGSYLWKVRSTKKWFRRKFNINIRDMQIDYSPSTRSRDCCAGVSEPKIDIAEICEVRRGWKTDVFNKIEEKQANNTRAGRERKNVNQNCCFSIIYGERKNKTLDLIAPTPDIAEKWVHAIEHLLSWYELKQLEAGYEIWLRKKFNAADSNNDKCLSFKETQALLFDLNIEITEREARNLFNLANTNPVAVGNEAIQVLNEDEFMVMYFQLLKRPETEEIFRTYISPVGTFTAKQLQNFLQKEQSGNEFISLEECSTLLQIYEYSDFKTKGQMTPAGFLNLLVSSEFDIFNHKKHKHVCQDMSQPLTHYFIASSHNTYIGGNQLSGKASVESYINTLKRGCKCVEIDCWDGEDNEPMVWHGHTFVTKIPFKDVLMDAIKPFAFVVSDFPLILSLEVHCAPLVRRKMASYLVEILGDDLYMIEPSDTLEFLPSPAELQRKILIKAKSVYGNKKVKQATVRNSTSISSTFLSPRDATTSSSQRHTYKPTENIQLEETFFPISNEKTRGSNLDLVEIESEDEDFGDSVIGGRIRSQQILDNDLPALVHLLRAKKFVSFEHSKLTGKCYEMSSFSEGAALKFMKENPMGFINYNKKQLSRIYPAATRAFSSNFMPVPFWRVGCQMVALNYQTADIPNLIHESMFQQNGGCGYILKPEFLRSDKTNPSDWFKNSCILKIRIISGQHLPKAEGNSEVVDPYVEFKVVGIAKEGDSENEFTTKKIQNNGFNPFWNETFQVIVKCPELAFVFFRVRDHAQSGSDIPLGYYAAPLTSIETGYRHIRLKNIGRDPIPPSSLFVHISITTSALQ